MTSRRVGYFAYGSNLNTAQVRKRLGRIPSATAAVLQDHRIAFNKPASKHPGFAYANAVPAAGEQVRGVLYDTTEGDLLAMDGYEGVASGDYERREVVVQSGGVPVAAITYIGCAGRVGPDLPPTGEYLRRILDGAQSHGFSPAEVARIEQAARVAT